MPKFRPGQSGNPSGRPRSAAGLRESLIDKYGADAGVLVERPEKLSTSPNQKVTLAATQLLLAYHAGRPENALIVDVTTQPAPLTAVELAFLTTEELETLAAILQRVRPAAERANRLLAPDGREAATDTPTPSGTPRKTPT